MGEAERKTVRNIAEKLDRMSPDVRDRLITYIQGYSDAAELAAKKEESNTDDH